VTKRPKQKRGRKTPMHKRALALDALLTLSDDQVLGFHEWCRLNRLSERTGRRIITGPDGPVVTMLSPRRYGVRVADNRAWQHARARTNDAGSRASR
jgi:hypothetical protein